MHREKRVFKNTINNTFCSTLHTVQEHNQHYLFAVHYTLYRWVQIQKHQYILQYITHCTGEFKNTIINTFCSTLHTVQVSLRNKFFITLAYNTYCKMHESDKSYVQYYHCTPIMYKLQTVWWAGYFKTDELFRNINDPDGCLGPFNSTYTKYTAFVDQIYIFRASHILYFYIYNSLSLLLKLFFTFFR